MHIKKSCQSVLLGLIGVAATAAVSRAQSVYGMGLIPDQSNRTSISFRVLNGAKIRFTGGKSSAFGPGTDVGPATGTGVDRTYDDGFNGPDGLTDDSGNLTTPDGYTYRWRVNSASQMTADGKYVDMHSYSASEGTLADGSKNSSSSGIEFTFRHDVTEPNKTAGWGLLFGFSGNDLSAKTFEKSTATLYTATDRYDLNGNTVPDGGYSTTPGTDGAVDIPAQPTTRIDAVASGTADVSTEINVKGTYFVFRMGPYWRLRLSDRFRVEVGAGAALTVAGTKLSGTDTFKTPGGTSYEHSQEDRQTSWMKGYYGDLTLDIRIGDRAHFFIGGGLETAGKYSQTNGVQTAQIDLSSLTYFQGGLAIAF